MNPREFCQQQGYPHALALCYTFDPLFFDRIVLPALWAGSTEEILVLADGEEISQTLARVHGPIHHLGRRYVLAPIHSRGRFHPKLTLRLGRVGGIASLGSGNLTHGGWGLNREIATTWKLGPDLADSGGWIPDLLDELLAWTGSPLAERAIARMQELSWLERGRSSRVLFSSRRSLADLLRERWSGRRFSRLRFATGSTDYDGSVLQWLHDDFGLEAATGCVTPGCCSFNPDRIDELPLDLELIAHPTPMMHAKIYHLTGPEGDVLLIGSANCSASGWLRSPREGGNVEMMLVYEPADSESLSVLENLFQGAPQPPREVLIGGLEEKATREQKSQALLLQDFQIDEIGRLVVTFESSLDGSWTYQAVVGNQTVPLTRSGDKWTGLAPEMLPVGQTAFGLLEALADDGHKVRSDRRWLDDLRILHESSHSRAAAGALGGLPKPASRRADDQLLQELGRLAHDLIHDLGAVPDPLLGQGETKRAARGQKVESVDPRRLIRNLRNEPAPGLSPTDTSAGPATSLSGVFRALFNPGEEHPEGHEVEAEGEEPEPDENNGSSPDGPVTDRDPTSHRSVETKTRDKFERHLDRFVEGLRSPDFQEGCTATQMVQAVAYPLAATTLGLHRGWTGPERAREWATAVAEVLLRSESDKNPSLLTRVKDRYAAAGCGDLFQDIVGEGTLWVTMVVGIASIDWPTLEAGFHRLMLLRDLWAEEVLRAGANTERMEFLIRSYRAADAVRVVSEIAAPAIAAASELEGRLKALWARMPGLCATSRDPIQSGELLWGLRNGWAVARNDECNGKARVYLYSRALEAQVVLDRHFLNVQQAARYDSAILAELNHLLWLVRAQGDCHHELEAP